MRRRTHLCGPAVAALAVALAAPALAAPPPPDPLRAGFADPPQTARPRVWWHWLNGNVTVDGITKDIDWMRRVGIGGMQTFDADLSTPQVVDKRLVWMSPQWKSAFRAAASLAEADGLELTIAASPGWSETGSPQVTPEQAMKKLVFSRTAIAGGRRFKGPLSAPPSTPGPFQDLPLQAPFGLPLKHAAPSFYRDVAVVAFRSPAPAAAPRLVTSSGEADAGQLGDGMLADGLSLAPPADGGPVWLALRYRKPVKVQGLTIAVDATGVGAPIARLEASDDGKSWSPVASAPPTGFAERTIAFAPVTARYFRVTLEPTDGAGPPDFLTQAAPGAAPPPLPMPPAGPAGYVVHELALRQDPTVHRFEEKAGFATALDYYALDTVAPGEGAPQPADVIDITAQMAADGTLDWTPPPGTWTVLRVGYSLTGAETHPAAAEATGLEVDKLSRAHVRAYLEDYLKAYQAAAGADLFGRKGVRALLTDSIEAGPQTWTEDMASEFARRRGYELWPWLPALTGVVVQSPQASDRFLWDWRRTIAELIAENHYGQVAEVAHAHGLSVYGEALEDHRPVLGDDLEMRRSADAPMAAMWTWRGASGARPTFVADIKGAASVAHLWGQNIVAAESMTSAIALFDFSPRTLKPVIDLEFALGVNRPVIHTSVHQPLDKPPGLTLSFFGQSFSRLDSWSELAGPWVAYIARSAYLLQQGRYAADLAYFYGEEAPLTALYGDHLNTDVPAGYGFDYVNADALLHRLKVKDGMLVTDTGMSYRALYLGGSSRRMTLATLNRLKELVAAGAVVIGERPQGSPSHADDPAAVSAAADAIWGAPGVGKVIAGRDLKAALAALKLDPDFDYARPEPDAELMALHRRLDDGDLYFVSNRKDRPERLEASFRVAGRQPELWDAVTGQVAQPVWRSEGGRTIVSLDLQANGSTFVVFRMPAASSQGAPAPTQETTVATVDGSWDLEFQPGRGAPAKARLDKLASWTDSADPGIRYFSGIATYRTTVKLPARRPGSRLLLDLGAVREVAEVSLNGKPVATTWTAPWRLDITGAAKAGGNTLQVRVANLWVNRLVGDAQPGAQKIGFTVLQAYRADAPLRPSGLLGPVKVVEVAPPAAPVRPSRPAPRPPAAHSGLRGPQ